MRPVPAAAPHGLVENHAHFVVIVVARQFSYMMKRETPALFTYFRRKRRNRKMTRDRKKERGKERERKREKETERKREKEKENGREKEKERESVKER